MPDDWQARMARLMEEWDDTWTNPPNIETIVSCKSGNKFVKAPDCLTNYRHPDMDAINQFRSQEKRDA